MHQKRHPYQGQLFGRRGVPIRGGLLWLCPVPSRSLFSGCWGIPSRRDPLWVCRLFFFVCFFFFHRTFGGRLLWRKQRIGLKFCTTILMDMLQLEVKNIFGVLIFHWVMFFLVVLLYTSMRRNKSWLSFESNCNSTIYFRGGLLLYSQKSYIARHAVCI